MRHEWDMHFVPTGAQALQFMSAQPVDIIISDMIMPEMDGSQLLSEVLKSHPRTVRIVLSGHAEREAVLRLVGPAHQYLSKPCDPDELRQAIARAFSLRDLLGNERLKQLTTRLKDLPTLPALQNQLSEELRKDSPSMDAIGEIISRDIGMTAKILQLVNSAFFCLGRPIGNPADAAAYLGITTLRSLVLSMGIFSQYDQRTCSSFSLEMLANHSWVAAAMARRVAQIERRDSQFVDECFLAGLLHDTGQLVLAFGLHEEYGQVAARAKAENLPVWRVEQEIFGATHADVGAYLLALWGLPNPVVEAVALHHQPARSAARELSPAIAIHVADVLAHNLSETDTEVPPPQLDIAYLTQIGLVGRLNAWVDGCKETANR